jgi:hypothetical protein
MVVSWLVALCRSCSAWTRFCSVLRFLAMNAAAASRRRTMTAMMMIQVTVVMRTPGVPVPGGARGLLARP